MRATTVLMCGALLLAPAAVAEEGYGPLIANGLDEQLAIGADLFFSETFDGNGRTCATCHLATENYTLPADLSGPEFGESSLLMIGDPDHPDHVTDLELCHRDEDPDELNCEAIAESGLILVNGDEAEPGFDGFVPSYVMRSVPHTLSMTLTLEPALSPGVPELTGWAGDGSPLPGQDLNSFSTGAVRQHFTKHVDRIPPGHFREPTQAELDAMEDFQLELGRTAQVDLALVEFYEQNAKDGKKLFGGLNRRCQNCHGTATRIPADANVLTNSMVEQRRINRCNSGGSLGAGDCPQESFPIVDGANFDGGFGIDDVLGDTRRGNGKFDPPPLIEAVDTPPFFHDNRDATLEEAISHYRSPAFLNGADSFCATHALPCGLEPADASDPGGFQDLDDAEEELGSMLRILNAGLNLSMATQRLSSAADLLATEPPSDPTVTKTLELAFEEIDDAWTVLDDSLLFEGNPVFEDTGSHISLARSDLYDAKGDLMDLITNGPLESELDALIADLVAVSENHLSDDFYDAARCGSGSYDDCDWIFEPGEANKLFDNSGVIPSIIAGQTQAVYSPNPNGTGTVTLEWKTAEWSNPLFDKAKLTNIGTGITIGTGNVTVTPLANGTYKRTASITVPCEAGAKYSMEGFSRVGGTTESDDDTAKAPRYCIAF